MKSKTLHITNGDSAASLIVASTVPGDVLPWRDVLHDGPVPGGLSLAELSQVRAGYLSEGFGKPLPDVQGDFALRDEQLQGCDRYDEVILWFEHDLYDQLQLLQLLDWLHAHPRGHARCSMICIDRFPGIERFQGLGQLDSEQIATLHGKQVEITPQQTALGAEGWRAFTHSDPTQLNAYCREDLNSLPFMRDAVTRLLEEYPCVKSGLSRTEQRIVEIVADGEVQPGQMFARNQLYETAPYMGDWSFWRRIENLCGGTRALLECTPGPFHYPPGHPFDDNFRAQQLRLTKVGKDVLAGCADWLNLHPVDVWLGGTHLVEGAPMWRWNEASRTIEASG